MTTRRTAARRQGSEDGSTDPGLPLEGLPAEALGLAAERVAGVDEAGRGSLAGPVVAAAVILPAGADLPGLTDSKLLSPAARRRLAEAIRAVAVSFSVAAVEAAEIDATDILRATLAAMALAVEGLDPPPALVLVDGNVTPPLAVPARAIVRGDRCVAAISAASILAKVTRDRTMEEWGLRFPWYGFAQHKGYGTAEHLAQIARRGPSPIHRRTFGGVREHVDAPAQERLW
ncbi:MAG: ribonuclease HII [Candidatus Methylomirabilota bacterium]